MVTFYIIKHKAKISVSRTPGLWLIWKSTKVHNHRHQLCTASQGIFARLIPFPHLPCGTRKPVCKRILVPDSDFITSRIISWEFHFILGARGWNRFPFQSMVMLNSHFHLHAKCCLGLDTSSRQCRNCICDINEWHASKTFQSLITVALSNRVVSRPRSACL